MNKHKLNFFPEMLPEDYARLKDDIDKNGYDINYPIWFYEGQILDGWNREKACNELNIEPVYAEFTGSMMDAIEFVMRSNKRRNLTSSQWACLAVEADEIIKALKEEAEIERRNKISNSRKGETTELIQSSKTNETAEKVADMFNTNSKYIYEAQKLKNKNPVLFNQVKNGEKTITEVKNKTSIVSLFTGNNEWYTPVEYIELARKVMGSIDLDPASNDEAQKIIKAEKYFTANDDGIKHNWNGNIWLNPPYSGKEIIEFIDKLIIEFENKNIKQAIVLTNDNTDTSWYHKLVKISSAICLLSGRIKFYNASEISAPTNGQTFFYLGSNLDNFNREFKKIGLIMIKYE